MSYSQDDLKLFVAIAERGSLTKGAAACGISNPTASMRLAKLEKHFNTLLFIRQARSLALTRAGSALVDSAKHVLASEQLLAKTMEPYSRMGKGSLAIWSSFIGLWSCLPQDLRGFIRQHPTLRIELFDKDANRIVEGVANGWADIGVTTYPYDYPGTVSYTYRSDQLVVIVPDGHPLSGRQSISFAEFSRWPVISMPHTASLQNYIDARADENSCHLNTRVMTSSVLSVVSIVASGAGIGLVPSLALPNHPHVLNGSVKAIALKESWAERPLKLVLSNERSSRTQEAEMLRTWLLEQASAERLAASYPSAIDSGTDK